MRMRRLASVAAVALCCVVGGLVSGGAPAWAFRTHLLSGSFHGSGASTLSGPAGVAVNDETGDVYVVDKGNNRVEEFDASGGTVLGEFNGASAGHALSLSGGIVGIAVDNSSNPLDPSRSDVYVVDTGNDVIDKFSASGTYLGQIVETTGGAAFEALFGVAVDPSGVVWVYQGSGEIDSFSDALANEYLAKRSSPFGGTGAGFAVDSEDNLYMVNGQPVVGKSNSSGELLIEALDSEASFGVAVNLSSDEVFVDNLTSVGVFGPSGSSLERFGAGQLGEAFGVAVNATNDRVYVADSGSNVVDVFDPALLAGVSTGVASNVAPTGVTLNGSVNPEGVPVTSCFFEYGTDTSYGQSVPCAQSPGSGNGAVAVNANVSGLTEGTDYHFRLVATTADGANQGSDGEVMTLPSPVIDGASATNVTATSVELDARIDPKGYDTTYHFEYGTSTDYGTSVPVPDGDIGASTGDVAIAQHVSGLQANTTYHWRVVAHNGNGTATGADHTFVYSTSGTTRLPDNRAYEMVTPPAKNAALIGDTFGGLQPAIAEDGSRVIMTSIQCFGDAASCPSAETRSTGSSFEFTRTGGGWAASALGPSATQVDRNSSNAVNADTGNALFTMPTPPIGEWDWYARRPDGSFVDIGPTAPSSSGPQLGVTPTTDYTGTVDLSHLVFEGSELWPFDETSKTTSGRVLGLYEYVGAGNVAPQLVGVSGGKGSTDLVSKCGTALGDGYSYENGALSADGRVVFFTAGPCASGSGVNAGVEVPAQELYARVDESRTIPLSQRSPLECTNASGCLGSPPDDAEFVAASVDGSRAFFLDTQQLSDKASEGRGTKTGGLVNCYVNLNDCNLYEYDFANPAGRNLVTVSAGDSSGGGARVQGVLAYSADGSYVYFVAKGALTRAGNERGQTARDGAENLYVFQLDASHPTGQISFITRLPEADNQEWGPFADAMANVTPDGRFLAFVSHGALTADDSSSTGAVQVFRYDAQTGQLVRISVGEDGFNDNGNAGVGNAVIAHQQVSLGARRSDPTMSHDGSYVFFESPVALTPGAFDDVPIAGVDETYGQDEQAYAENVYEWHGGHVYLLSDGRDVSANHTAPCYDHQSSGCLLGTDATGRNVFFTTADPLVPADTDTALDVYDARICTADEPCIPSTVQSVTACQGEACHGVAGVAPPSVDAATSSFSGAGNLAAPSSVLKQPSTKKKARVKCAKSRRLKRGRCVKTRKRTKAQANRAKSTHGGKK
jgi:DNA-binding beta-propeller fold protein YncE